MELLFISLGSLSLVGHKPQPGHLTEDQLPVENPALHSPACLLCFRTTGTALALARWPLCILCLSAGDSVVWAQSEQRRTLIILWFDTKTGP